MTRGISCGSANITLCWFAVILGSCGGYKRPGLDDIELMDIPNSIGAAPQRECLWYLIKQILEQQKSPSL
jgi:hypothetical protein